MAGRHRSTAAARSLGFALSIGLLVPLLAPVPAFGASANVTVHSDGAVAVGLSATIPNGSAVREAMDGNFTAIVGLITSNASQRSSLLNSIATAEGAPFIGALFGNRDGIVEPSEVGLFQSLLVQEAQFLPSGGLSGGSFLSFTLDGARAGSTRLAGIAFGNATGSVGSTADIPVATDLAYSFPYSGGSHALALTTNLTPTAVPLTLLTGAIDLGIVTPAGTSVTATSGFDQVRIANDALGWGTSSASGTFTPSTSGTLSVSFGAAFPVGDVAIAVPIVAAAGLLAFLFFRRRRRLRAAA
jgi:hypothetical protein